MSAVTYIGRCAVHGETPRYRSNRKCVACHTVPARYVVFSDSAMTLHHTLEDAQRHGEDVWLARRV